MAEKVMDLNRFIPTVPNHKPIHISIKEADTITFTCDDPFSVTDIKTASGTRTNPFHRTTLPFGSAAGSDQIHRTSSGPAQTGKQGRYKITFQATVGGVLTTIDPDFIVET